MTVTITAIATRAGEQVNTFLAASGSWDPAIQTSLAPARNRILAPIAPGLIYRGPNLRHRA